MTITQRLASLRDQGFDSSWVIGRNKYDPFYEAIRIKCSQCEALTINGISTHESGCPNIPRDTNDD